MNKDELERILSMPNGLAHAIRLLNDEINRLIVFARNSGTYQNRLFPDLVDISEDHK